MMGAMPREEAARAIASAVAIARIEAMGQIRHIAPCPFNGGTAYHVVLAVPQDKVTLFIMPTTPLPSRRGALLDGLHAAVVPAGTGAIGVVGADRDIVISIAGALRQG